MPQLTSPLSTPAGMAGVNPAHVGKMAGTRLHFPSFAAWTAAITSGATGFASDLWADGQEMTIADEADTGAVRVWRTSLAHARTVRMGGTSVVLAANTNLAIATSGVPSSGTGSVGDVAIDGGAGVYYTKGAGGWGSASSLYPVSGVGNLLSTATTSGDSFEALMHQGFIPNSAVVANGVATLGFAAAHGLYTGTKINATGGPSEAINGIRVAITRIDATHLSYPVPGAPDGVIVSGPAQYQIFAWSQRTMTGIYPHLQRLSKGSLRLLQAGGMSGHRMADVLARYETSLRPYKAKLHIHWGYFNDLQYGVTAAASAATVQQILTQRKADGCLTVCVSAIAVQTGVWTWPTLTAPLTTMTDATAAAWILAWNKLMSAWCLANGVIWIDVHTGTVDPATGYATAGACKANDIHPAARSCYLAAKLIYTRLSGAGFFSPRALASSALDNVGADSTNRNLCRAAPVAQGAGGTPGAGQTTAYTTWASSIGAAVAANRWRTNAGNLYFTAAGGTVSSAWQTGQAVTSGQYRINGGNLYQASSSGTTGATAPTHTAGSASDGAVSWQYISAAGPTHTSGSATGVDGIAWAYMGKAEGTAGVPASYRAINTSTALALTSLVDKASGVKAMRNTTYATLANDSSLQSYSFTLTDLVGGDVLDIAFLASLLTNFTGVAGGPSAQNVKSFTGYVEFQTDGVTYLVYEQLGGVSAANEQITDDLSDVAIVLEEVVVPTGSTTLARVHLQTQWSGAGQAATEMGCLTATH
tara:strand:+ start:1448 stop:3724 length:2277 start_codon:yes stop_codon:yes gene_type:complete